jgi:orotate phosphoribosyltransferase-like protein
MARIKDRANAIELRKSGLSYSQIKTKLNVSKSSLSLWLRDMPLSDKRLRQLRDHSQVRIEKTRETKRKKKEQRRKELYVKLSSYI